MNTIQRFLKFNKALDNNWTHISFVREKDPHPNGLHSNSHDIYEIRGDFNKDEISEWCAERCKGDYVVGGGSVLFENDKDALMFRFRFSNFE